MPCSQAYTALLGSAVKCGEAELAVDVYSQLRAQGFQLERHVFHVVLEVFLKLGRWQDALSVMDDMAAQVLLGAALEHLSKITGLSASLVGFQRASACSGVASLPADMMCMCLMQGLAVEVQTYNLMIATCVKMGQPNSAMAIYQR